MRTYYLFMRACWSNIKKQHLTAFKQYEESMGGNAYHPLLHKLALIELKKLCDMYKVDASGLN